MSNADQQTEVEQLATWALRASYDQLSKTSVDQAPTHVLDCVACCLSSLGAPPVNALKTVIGEMAGSGGVPLIGGGASTLVYAATWHTALVRYLDFMDNFLAAKETCHTADNFGAVLTTAAHVGASGKEFITALAVAYTAQSRYVDHGTFMESGLDHTSQLGFSVGAATGKLLGLSEAQIANGVACAVASGAAYDNIRSKPLSQWKGMASSQTVLGVMNAMLLAKHGVQGPLEIVEGSGGINQLLGKKIAIDWSKEGYEGIATSAIKKYNSEIHTQSSIDCMLQLRTKNKVDPGSVKSIEADVTDITYNFTGGGSYGPANTGINSKEQADHSLPYLLAVALIDGAVGPAQFDPDRIKRKDVQDLLCKVTAKADPNFTKAYPTHMPARITVTTTDGKSYKEEVQDYVGMPVRPFTWGDVTAKFGSITHGRVDKALADEITAAVKAMEVTSARDLLALLARVPTPKAPALG